MRRLDAAPQPKKPMNTPNAPLADLKTHDQTASLSGDDFIVPSELVILVKYKMPTIYEKIKRDEFPQPIRLGPRRAVWRRIDVQKWIESKIKADNAADVDGSGK